jgi:hypothetical protein
MYHFINIHVQKGSEFHYKNCADFFSFLKNYPVHLINSSELI